MYVASAFLIEWIDILSQGLKDGFCRHAINIQPRRQLPSHMAEKFLRVWIIRIIRMFVAPIIGHGKVAQVNPDKQEK